MNCVHKLLTCESCTKAVNFVPFSDPYTIGLVPMVKAQEDEDLLAAFVYTCYLLLLLLLVKSHTAVNSSQGEEFLAIHRVEYHCVNNLVRHKSSPSKGRLVRRSVFLQKDKN